jgi:hypothetical protein
MGQVNKEVNYKGNENEIFKTNFAKEERIMFYSECDTEDSFRIRKEEEEFDLLCER